MGNEKTEAYNKALDDYFTYQKREDKTKAGGAERMKAIIIAADVAGIAPEKVGDDVLMRAMQGNPFFEQWLKAQKEEVKK